MAESIDPIDLVPDAMAHFLKIGPHGDLDASPEEIEATENLVEELQSCIRREAHSSAPGFTDQ